MLSEKGCEVCFQKFQLITLLRLKHHQCNIHICSDVLGNWSKRLGRGGDKDYIRIAKPGFQEVQGTII